MVSLLLFIFAFLFCLFPTNCQQLQQWDDAIDAVKRDITDLAGKFRGSALFEGLSKAYDLSVAAVEVSPKAILTHNVSVLHIIDKLTLKRLYRIVSAHNQLAGYSYEVVYWIPSSVRSDADFQNVKVLHELLPKDSIRVLDMNDFTESERTYLGGSNCSGNLCFDLLAGKVRRLHKLKSDDTAITTNYDDFAYWLLDIDMSWFGDLAAVLERLIPPSTYSFPFSSYLNGDEENVIKSIDFLGACVGDAWMTPSVKSPLDTVYDKVRNDLDRLSTDISQVFKDTVEVITVQFYGNDPQIELIKSDRDTVPNSASHFYCWPEISHYSGNFLDLLYRTFESNTEGRLLRKREDEYFQIISDNNLKCHSFLESGLKEGLLGNDFRFIGSSMNNDGEVIKISENGNDENGKKDDEDSVPAGVTNHQNGESYLVSEKEFDQLKHQFLEQKNEPFVFEWKAGTLFRNIN